MAKYRKKPVVIDATQMDHDGKIFDYLHGVDIPYKATDWIITGTKGEKYPCIDAVFKEVYEPIDG